MPESQLGEGIGRRIRRRVGEVGMSITALWRAVQQELGSGGHGAKSYASIHNLYSGKSKRPNDRVLDAVATVLGVNTEWLRSGSGEMDRSVPSEDEELVNRIPSRDFLIPPVSEHIIGSDVIFCERDQRHLLSPFVRPSL